ncbi:uncharacterized protein FFUJ_01924 [Fusarium fujikuroi IMI 58289]|uniref:Uncharacterized protein n=1 Tax=Gibberella fujikuroi (strain CBS 195.34 / IMI 58289 / NRRL A-6831) TaxID=1279085 RepID=S0DHI3_GIBF5|nr:uncharacterized protein FFUJ_01924 [Fusarium fujikuroi IMI 58289]KLO86525.1 uncharacterized protein LW93_11301 [Fusarium fujikuroi]KLP19790.1 uncharacterized protein LW94_4505 [Fusarium fujikuroi]CCT61589.1 uncharacterized protein FFUJ_01924 [Fusarium fujikuroi IMI 58289]SCO12619.1 uncharacterized protein FFM5_10348 [Fusarium fujikuroi]SCO27298.1 uncharacterized protein FFMR_00177 [Fusarium fujikuroi]
MGSPAFALNPTGYMSIDTVEHARAVVTQCINGDLQLVPRGPDDREAAQFSWPPNAVFVFEVSDQVSRPPAYFDESEPEFFIRDIPGDTRVNLRHKSITIVENGRRYCVVVIFSSQTITNHYGHPRLQMLWPTELKLSEIHTPSQTCVAGLEAALQDMRDSGVE